MNENNELRKFVIENWLRIKKQKKSPKNFWVVTDESSNTITLVKEQVGKDPHQSNLECLYQSFISIDIPVIETSSISKNNKTKKEEDGSVLFYDYYGYPVYDDKPWWYICTSDNDFTIESEYIRDLSREYLDQNNYHYFSTKELAERYVKENQKEDNTHESGNYSVYLSSFGSKKLNVIKVVKMATNLGLKETKDLVESCPITICTNVSDQFASSLVHNILREGGIANVAYEQKSSSNNHSVYDEFRISWIPILKELLVLSSSEQGSYDDLSTDQKKIVSRETFSEIINWIKQ